MRRRAAPGARDGKDAQEAVAACLSSLSSLSPPAKRLPVRTCAGCGAKRPPREMLRVASRAGGAPQIDLDFRAVGRGAYLCRQAKCLERALARRALERALKLKQAVPAALRDEIARVISGPRKALSDEP